MKKSLLLLLASSLCLALYLRATDTVPAAAENTAAAALSEEELLLAVNQNFGPARPAGANTNVEDKATAPAPKTTAKPAPKTTAQPAPKPTVKPAPAPKAVAAPKPAPAPKVIPAPKPAATVKPAPKTVPAPPPVATTPATTETPAPVAQPAPAPQPEPVAVAGAPERTEAEKTAKEELIRRQEAQLAARQMIGEGQLLLDRNKDAEAVEKFEAALKILPEAKATEDDRAEALDGLNRGYYRLASAALENNELGKAREYANKSLAFNPESRAAQSVIAKVERAETRAKAEATKPPRETPLDATPELLKKQADIRKLFREGKVLLASGQFDEATERFKQIILIDPYNTDALSMIDAVNGEKLKFAQQGAAASRNERLWQVTQGWLPKFSSDVKPPEAKTGGTGFGERSAAETLILSKLNTLRIPEINLRDAVITDVVNYLSTESRRLDLPTHEGVNIVLQIGQAPEGAGAAPAAPMGGGMDAFPGEGVPAAPAAVEPAGVRRVTVNLRNIPMIDALKYITSAAGLKFRVESSAVIILPKDAPEGEVVTRSYPVEAAVIKELFNAPSAEGGGGGGDEFTKLGGGGATIERIDVKKFFTDAGVPFPVGSSIVYNERISTIVVRNTPENLETFERILSAFNVIPKQVEIEAKFVDIAQGDLNELGFDWRVGKYTFGDFAAVAGGTSSSDSTTGQGGGGTTGNALTRLTTGLRDSSSIRGNALNALLGTGGISGPADVATLAGILTDPQFSVVIRMLSQKQSTDLLSAPKVTTISGNAAQIRIVQEFIYPTEYSEPQVGDNVVSPSIPSGFKTREIGVLLNVTPTVGADGYTINLTLIPEVSEFLGFIDYSPGETVNTSSVGGSSTVNRVTNKILQPLFASRNLATTIVIWDGQTVVLGGLIREDVNKIDDKVPFLGDIPVLGRLFRSKSEVRSKRNLLIFVTARLIDPAGRPIHRGDITAATTGTGG